jgi:hypothetical protein
LKALAKMLPFRRENVLDRNLPSGAEYALDRLVRNVEHGRFERMLSGLTAFSALLVSAETYYEHYRGSFGNKLMWSPILVTPPVVAAGIAGVFSKRAAKTALPMTAAVYTATGLVGIALHVRGVARKPGGWREATYNVVMGPPVIAPGLFAMVGGMGLLAALLRREG